MPDPIFAHPRLVAIYDEFEGARNDLDPYIDLVDELGARSVLDIDCGTGTFAGRLVEKNLTVIGVDPARQSLEFARQKPFGKKVRWIHGDAIDLPRLTVDLVTMTGNVAQVFLTEHAWEATLTGIRRALTSSGHFIFETRNPDSKAWLDWTPHKTRQCRILPNVGSVETFCDVLEVVGDLVTFRWTYKFASDGCVIESISTLRFRERTALEQALEKTGYVINDVRDAPDRPGKEMVFICSLQTY